MRKILLLTAILLCGLFANAQSWQQVGNTFQIQKNGSSYTNGRINMGTPGFFYWYSKSQVDSLFGHIDLTGYVPYVNANQTVDLNGHDLNTVGNAQISTLQLYGLSPQSGWNNAGVQELLLGAGSFVTKTERYRYEEGNFGTGVNVGDYIQFLTINKPTDANDFSLLEINLLLKDRGHPDTYNTKYNFIAADLTGSWQEIKPSYTDILSLYNTLDARLIAGVVYLRIRRVTIGDPGSNVGYYISVPPMYNITPTSITGNDVSGVTVWNQTPLTAYNNALYDKTGALYGGGGGGGTVTAVSGIPANGFTWSIANPTTTPAITLTLQNATTSQSGQLTSTDWNTFNGKQATLVSGTNIKTVNSNSLLGSGNVAVGDALVANPLSQFASTTSAQLRGVLSDETGTGVAVFNNSPALLGIPTTPTPSLGDSSKTVINSEFLRQQRAADAIYFSNQFKGAATSGDPLRVDSTKIQKAITLTTTSTSGAATFNQATGALNIPNYTVGATWGSISGTLSSQTDLQTALNAKNSGSGTANQFGYYTGSTTQASTPFLRYAFNSPYTTIGVGTGTPGLNDGTGAIPHLFEINNDNTGQQVFKITTAGSTGLGGQNNMHWDRFGGTYASPTQTTDASYYMSMGFRGVDQTNTITGSLLAFQAQQIGDLTSTNQTAKFIFQTTPSGHTTSDRTTILELLPDTLSKFFGPIISRKLIAFNSSTALTLSGSADDAGAVINIYGSSNGALAKHRATAFSFGDLTDANKMTYTPSTKILSVVNANVTGSLSALTNSGAAGTDSVLVTNNGLIKKISPTYYGTGGSGITGVTLGSFNNDPTWYEGLIATRGLVPNQFNPAFTQFMSRSVHYSSQAITSLKIVVPNFYINGSFAEAGTGASETVTASIEYPLGTFTQIKFSASATGTVPNNSTLTSDYSTVSIPAGTQFWIRMYIVNANGLLFEQTQQTASLGGGYIVGTSGVPDLTLSGSYASFTSSNTNISPLAIIGLTNKPSVIVVGDSRADGINDLTTDATGNYGDITKSFGFNYGYASLSTPGDFLANFLSSSTNRQSIFKYATHIVNAYQYNDVWLTGLTSTAAQTQATTFQNMVHALNKKVYNITIGPRTTSTDSWATTTNQALYDATKNTNRVAYNTLIRAGNNGQDGYFDISSINESSLNSGKWAVTGAANYATTDGIHETSAMNTLIQTSAVIPTGVFLTKIVPTAPNGTIAILASTSTTLVSGTSALSIAGVTTGSHAYVTYVVKGGTVTTTIKYAAVCTTGTVTVTALTSADIAVTSDTSTVNVFVTN